jgi:hypothetical protein
MLPPVEVMTEMQGLGRRAFGEAKAVGKRAFVEAKAVFAGAKDTGRHTITEAEEVGLRTSKAVKGWWKGLPNDGARAGIVAGTALVIGLIPALVIIVRRRGAS